MPPRISDSIFGWVSPLIHTKEPILVDKIGLDAAIFLRFLRMMRWLFTAIAFIVCAILIPVNVTYNLKHVKASDRDALSFLTIRDVRHNLLYVHVATSYLICFVLIAFVWFNWRKVVELRNAWFRSPEYVESFYARTLMVNSVPRKYQSDEGIRAIFESVQVPYPTTSVHIGRTVGKLPELIEYHNETVKELEAVLVKYLKDGKIGKKRPTKRLGGFMCFGGRIVDAIDYYTYVICLIGVQHFYDLFECSAKLQRTERAVEEYRDQIDTRRPENYGFASMAAVPYAHIVANMLRAKRIKGATVHLAPNPKDIVSMSCFEECTIHTAMYADLGESKYVSRRTLPKEDYRMGFPLPRLLFQHYPIVHHIHPGQLGVSYVFCAIPSIVVERIPGFVHFYLWCTSAGCVGPLWLLPPHHHALALPISRRLDSLTAGPRCHCPLLRILGYLPVVYLHTHWGFIQ